MVWLPDGEKISKISLFVLTQLTNVTDTETHTHTETPHDGICRAYALHRAAKITKTKQYNERFDRLSLQINEYKQRSLDVQRGILLQK